MPAPRSQCGSQSLVLSPSPITAGKQSHCERFQGNSQCNSLKRSLFVASHRSLRHPLMAPAIIQKFTHTQQLSFKNKKKKQLQERKNKGKNPSKNPLLRQIFRGKSEEL